MSVLMNKIDFAVVVDVKNANPNGDPLNGNRPRTNLDGYGEISDVCIKRKIRNRLLDAGYDILIQSDDYRKDGDEYPSIKHRVEEEIDKKTRDDKKAFYETACGKWLDVRAFGQVFAFKGKDVGKGVSIGVRGPVSVHTAISVAPVNVTSMQITKSTSGEGDGKKKASDTMGMKHRVDHGVYVFYGSINPQLAEKTGFTEEDAEAIKQTLTNLFQNDASSARPEGSMKVHKVYWWKHSSKIGQYSSAKVHRSLQVKMGDKPENPIAPTPIITELSTLDGLEPEVIDGF